MTGKYKKDKEGVEFVRYLTDEGWHIIPIKAADQLVRCLSWGLPSVEHLYYLRPILMPSVSPTPVSCCVDIRTLQIGAAHGREPHSTPAQTH
jgi:hypothetical protein